MDSLTPRERMEMKKSFLKRLPIWNEVQKDVGVVLTRMEFDVKVCTENLQRIGDIVNNFPKIATGFERTVHPCKQHNKEDIVKVYDRNKSGELIIETVNSTDEDSINRQRQTLNATSSDSIELLKKKPCTGELVFARRGESGPWVKCDIRSVYHKAVDGRPITCFKLMTCDGQRTIKVGKFEVARIQDHGNKLRPPKRVVAGVDDDSMEPGIIGQEPHEVMNKNRYMVFLDKGTCQYFEINQVYPIFYQSPRPWNDLQQLGRRDKYFVSELQHYFKAYPKRYLIVAKPGQKIEVSRNGVVVPGIITKVDCDVMTVTYKDGFEESIHRYCPRANKKLWQVSLLLKDSISMDALFPRLLGNMKRYHDAGTFALGDDYLKFVENFERSVSICGNTARKSTGPRPEPRIRVDQDEEPVCDDRDLLPFLSDLLASSPRAKHRCDPSCLRLTGIKTELDVPDIEASYRDTSDIKIPLILGWKRLMVKVKGRNRKKPALNFVYESPCGRIIQGFHQMKSYFCQTGSQFDMDHFTFDKEVILNRNLGERRAFYFEPNIAVSKSGKLLENKHISIINPINEERLPLDFEYRSDTFPHPMLKAKGFSFNHEFKSGCDCEDDCNQRASCACHRLTEQAAGVTAHNRGQIDPKCHYRNKRLLQQVSTGIFECNSFCKCSSRCPNRVVQNGIRIRMQVRKTLDKGWGVFVLDDVPKGSFICTYSAELLDDADQYGDSDMYYADLDYITIVEQQKLDLNSDDEQSDEGLEIIDEGDEKADDSSSSKSKQVSKSTDQNKSAKRPIVTESENESDTSPSQDEYMPRPDVRYPKRNRKVVQKKETKKENLPFKKIHSILNETQDYTLDARMQGNVGRFFNHSCDPNSMVQNVFIDTHDLRFPVVAFFTKRNLKADDEINWHYNYKIDSIAGRQISCNCGASNCMGRIL